MMAYGT